MSVEVRLEAWATGDGYLQADADTWLADIGESNEACPECGAPIHFMML